MSFISWSFTNFEGLPSLIYREFHTYAQLIIF